MREWANPPAPRRPTVRRKFAPCASGQTIVGAGTGAAAAVRSMRERANLAHAGTRAFLICPLHARAGKPDAAPRTLYVRRFAPCASEQTEGDDVKINAQAVRDDF